MATFDLVRQKIYPDSVGGNNVVTYGYNRQGELKGMSDQNGTVHEYNYDGLGRFVDDRVTTLGGTIDGYVKRISRSYDTRGLLETVNSYDNATVGSGTLRNQVKREYNDFGQLAREYQVHDATSITPGSPHVDYGYADGSENSVRREAITYPNGRALTYDYGASGSIDRMAGRVFQIKDDGTARVRYIRRGIDSTVRLQYLEPLVEMTYLNQGPSGDRYTGLDRFDRIVDIPWLKSGSAVDQYQYGFDRAGNRTYRHNVTAPTSGSYPGWDELYAYDGLYQLDDLKRGVLDSSHTGINGTPRAEEDFTYDPTGNWLGYVTKAGTSTTLDQSRTHNAANEIATITNPTSSAAYDHAGNMTTMPKVGEWTAAQTVTWDAWNRLVKITVGTTTIGEYRYDGLFRRAVKISNENGTSATRHFYYSDRWQILEERVGTAAVPERHFIWGTRYLDDLVLRDRKVTSSSSASSSSSGGSSLFNERFYATHDQWHCTALLTSAGSVAMRVAYDVFGGSITLTSAYAPQSTTYDWETRYGSYHFDKESGLYAVRYRYLHPGLGRWVSGDPLASSFATGFEPFATGSYRAYLDALGNLFLYVHNMPTQSTDVFGLKATFDGCDENQKKKIQDSFDKFCGSICDRGTGPGKCCEALSQVPPNKKVLDRVKDKCDANRTHFTCAPPNDPKCKPKIKDTVVTGYHVRGEQNRITICPDGFKGGDVGCVIIHELVHDAGRNDETLPNQLQACFPECSEGIPH